MSYLALIPKLQNKMSEFLLSRYIYLSMMMGLGLFFSGILALYASKHLANNQKWAWSIAFISSIFVLFSMAGAMLVKFNNGAIPLIVIGGIINIILLLKNKKHFSSQVENKISI